MTADENNIAEIPEETLPSGNDLIDATQNAIIDAAENVSEALTSAEKTVQAEPLPEAEPFYADVEFWVGVAFILVVVILIKYGYATVVGLLKARIKNVSNEIDDAIKLRDDAQKLLAEYERKFINTESEVQSIVEQAKQNIETLRREETTKLKNDIKSKEADVQRRIAGSIEKAKSEINASIGQRSVFLAQTAVKNYLDNTDKSRLIDDALEDLDKLLKTEQS
jgi:F-type H+-transporting ATPase subunit b